MMPDQLGAADAARKATGSSLWLFIFALWILLFAVGVTLALALGIWNLWQAF